MSNPLVSVNMVVYNGEQFISDSIQSILNQTYANFELVIVNDGSIDKTSEIINLFEDSRIKYFENDNNIGQNISRNIALKHSIGKYVAVMDADDISYDHRLEKQIKFMEENEDYGLIGSLAEVIDHTGKPLGIIQSKYFPPDETMVYLFFRNCFTHSSILFRKEILEKVGINKKRLLAADYEIIVKASRFMKVGNINEKLVKYRRHDNSELYKNKNKKDKYDQSILINQINELGLNPSKVELNIHHSIYKKFVHSVDKDYYCTLNWLDQLFNANRKMKIFPESVFYKRISGYWFNLINNPAQYKLKLLQPYFSSPILKSSNRTIKDHLKFIIKCMLKYNTERLII